MAHHVSVYSRIWRELFFTSNKRECRTRNIERNEKTVAKMETWNVEEPRSNSIQNFAQASSFDTRLICEFFFAIVHSFSIGYWFHRVAFPFASCSRVLNDLCQIWLQKRKKMTRGFAIAMTIWISMRERYFIHVFFPQVFFRYCSISS